MAQDNDFLDTIGIPEYFCETLVKIEKIGSCRRLIFVINRGDGRGGSLKTPVATLVLPAEALADIAQMLAADIHVPRALASLSPNALAN
jgi:hypothetical protein